MLSPSDRNTQIKQTFGVTTTAYNEHDSGKWCSDMTTNESPNQQNLRNIKSFIIIIQYKLVWFVFNQLYAHVSLISEKGRRTTQLQAQNGTFMHAW